MSSTRYLPWLHAAAGRDVGWGKDQGVPGHHQHDGIPVQQHQRDPRYPVWLWRRTELWKIFESTQSRQRALFVQLFCSQWTVVIVGTEEREGLIKWDSIHTSGRSESSLVVSWNFTRQMAAVVRTNWWRFVCFSFSMTYENISSLSQVNIRDEMISQRLDEKLWLVSRVQL